LKNRLLDRELDFLPSTVNRDEVRELARRYGPQRKRSAPKRMLVGLIDFLVRYSAPVLGMIAGAEIRAAQALYPLMGEEERMGDSLRLFLGEDIGRKISDMNKAFEMTGALVAATPKIVFAALYGAVLGIVVYYVAKWFLVGGLVVRRRRVLQRKIEEILV
jgi:hypothetical protein